MTRSSQRAATFSVTDRCAFAFLVSTIVFNFAVPTHSTVRAAEMDDTEHRAKTIRGEVKLEPPEFAFDKADLIVSIEELSPQDAKVVRLAQQKFERVSYDGNPNSVLKFTMEGIRPDPKKRYKIRILVDLDHNGRISKGDFRSTRPPYVFTGKDSDPLVIKAQRLKPD